MSRRGFVAILVGVALVLIATNIRSGWLYLVSSLLFAAVLASFLASLWTVRGLTIERASPEQVFEGEPFGVSFKIRSRSRFAKCFLLVKDLTFEYFTGRKGIRGLFGHRGMKLGGVDGLSAADREKEKRWKNSIVIERIEPMGFADAALRLTAPRRGIYDEARIELSSYGLLGLSHARAVLSVKSRILVFPMIRRIESFPFEPIPSYSPQEFHEWTRKGTGQDYFGVREYLRGDSLRHIHWKVSAREGKLIVKEFQQEFAPSSAVVVALAPTRYGSSNVNSLEDGLRAAASISAYYSAMGSLPQVIAATGLQTRVSSPPDLDSCLGLFSSYEPEARAEPEGILVESLEITGNAVEPGAEVAIVTNATPESVEGVLVKQKDLSRFSIVIVVDDSYKPDGHRRVDRKALREISGICESAGGSFFVVEYGRDLGRCLSARYVTTG
ncbi:MAG: DUF58 domain-containing protein [Actinomycetota bacterium]|nr:DUF58 domain-containing protein [Actinomycetota bacterium]